MAILIDAPGGFATEHAPRNGSTFSLAELHEAVGGYIEMVTLAAHGTTRVVLFVNEDGIRLGLAPNPVASAMVRESGLVLPGPIVGPALLCIVANAGADDERVF